MDEDYAILIAASMVADGQRTPIEVRAADKKGFYRLIAGAHRHRAAEIVGLADMQAVVLEVSDLDARRLQIEENLCRHELNELDRAGFVAEWKAVYLALENASKHGGRRVKGQVANDGHLKLDRFSSIAADRLGLSEKTIRHLAKRYVGIAADVRASIAGTWLSDHGAELDFLSRLQPAVQRQVVALMRARGATSIKQLRDEVMGRAAPVVDADQADLDTLLKLWRRMRPAVRRRFLAELDKDAQFDLGGAS